MHLCTAESGDLDVLVDLTIRAFESIQDGVRAQLGDALFEPQNGDWRGDYRRTLGFERDRPDPTERPRIVFEADERGDDDDRAQSLCPVPNWRSPASPRPGMM